MGVPVPPPGWALTRLAEELSRQAGASPAEAEPPAEGELVAAEAELVEEPPAVEQPITVEERPVVEERLVVEEPITVEEPPAVEEPAAPQPSPYEQVLARLDELVRLRRHDAELVDRLHADNAQLRQGELTEALAPLLRGLLRLHDQMTSLGADDPQSIAGILRGQLLQTLDLAVDVRPYTAVLGMPFDSARHTGVRRVPTEDAARDGTIARTVKPGFVRGGVAVVRPAEVEVFRLDR